MAQPKPRTIIFLSDKSAFRYIRRSQAVKYRADGGSYNDPTIPEISYQFNHGRLELEPGQDMLPDNEFDLDKDGNPKMQDAASWIRQQPTFGVWVHEIEQAAPDAGPVYAEIAQASAERDVERLVAIGDAEHANWNRREVLDVIEASLATIEQPEPEKAKA